MSDHPRMLYRKGNSLELHGAMVDIRIVEDAEEEAAAKAQGWVRTIGETQVKAKPADEVAGLREQLAEAKDAIKPFDGDGDGKPGGRRKLSIKAGE